MFFDIEEVFLHHDLFFFGTDAVPQFIEIVSDAPRVLCELVDIEIVDRMDIQCNLLAEHGPVEADNALARGEAAWVATAKGVEVIDLCEGEVAAVVVGA